MVQLPQNKKTRISIEHLASNVTINSYLGHDLYLAFFKIKYWIGRWLPWNWNERWTYLLDARPQMWLSVSLWSWPWCFLSHGGLWKQKIISLIGCEAHRLDITDSYWVDLRCWYAIDSSSLKAYTYLQFWWVSGPWTTAGPHDRAIYRVNALEIQQSCAEQSLCWLIGEFCGVMMCPLCTMLTDWWVLWCDDVSLVFQRLPRQDTCRRMETTMRVSAWVSAYKSHRDPENRHSSMLYA